MVKNKEDSWNLTDVHELFEFLFMFKDDNVLKQISKVRSIPYLLL